MKLLAPFLLALLPLAAQDPKPTPPKPPPVGGETQPKEPSGADGKALVPGALPADATKEAREAWQKTLAASVQAGAERPPIQAFSLEVDAEFKLNPERVNQADADFDFLASKGWLNMRFKSGIGHIRGPDGDWMIDPGREGAVKLTRSLEDRDDVRQIDDAVVVARNFLALTNPATLRIARLALLPAPPAGIPQRFAERAKALSWLEVRSPDFRLSRSMGAGDASGLHRVQLGIDAQTSLPMLALILDPATPPQGGVGPATLFLELRDWFVESGYKLPKQIDTFEIESAPGAAPSFRREPTTSVVLKKARINPELGVETFRPPPKR